MNRIVAWVSGWVLAVLPLISRAGPAKDWRQEVQDFYRQGLEAMAQARKGSAEERETGYTKALEAFAAARKSLTDHPSDTPESAEEHQAVLSEINSCIYWASKFRPALPGGKDRPEPPATPQAPLPQGVSPEEEAGRLLAEVDTFAQRNPDDAFRAAMRYFEVADRFHATEAGRQAMRQCMDRMQRCLDEQAIARARLPFGAQEPVEREVAEVALRDLRKEGKELLKLLQKRDETTAKLKSIVNRLEEIRSKLSNIRGERDAGGGSGLAALSAEWDQLSTALPGYRSKLKSQEAKVAKQEEEMESRLATVRKFGKKVAMGAVKGHLGDPGIDKASASYLRRLDEEWDPTPKSPPKAPPNR